MLYRGDRFLCHRGLAISCKTFLLFVMVGLTREIGAKTFTETSEVNGTVLCATEEPSLVFEPLQPAVPSTEATSCVPLGMYCAWKCQLDANCTNFNYREDSRGCELFFYTPSNCSFVQSCTHSEVNGLGSCRKLASSQPRNCSFPFTYIGQLIYNCTQNANDSFEVGCYSENRVWITCPLSQLNYVARNVTINLTIPTFASPTQVISVDNWVVVQQRLDNSTNFARNWSEYRNGFGVYNSNYWMGLERMHQLTNSSQFKLRIEVYYPTLHQWRSAEYESFAIDAETNNYTLRVSGYSGDADDGLQSSLSGKMHNGMQFSSPDVDNDRDSSRNCAQLFLGGWWFNACCYVDLNGLIDTPNSSSNFFEYYVGGKKTAVQMSRMMIRRV